MSGTIPAISALTPENHAAIVITVSYAFIIITIVFVAIRVVTTFLLKRNFSWDDALLMIAVIIGLAQSVVTERSASTALGRHMRRVSPHDLQKYYKLAYAGSILSLFAQACAKSAAVYLMKRLSAPHSKLHKLFPLVHGAILLWLVFSVFALAFQCGLPRPWVYIPGQCSGYGPLWYPVLIIDVLTDAFLSAVFIPSVYKLQMRLTQRLAVISWFATRLTVCAFAIAQLVTLVPALKSKDTTRAMVIPVVLGQCVMNMSILTAAAPSLHRFFNELHSQGFHAAIPSTQIELSQAQGSNRFRSWGKSSQQPSAGSGRNKRNPKSHTSTVQDFDPTKSKASDLMADDEEDDVIADQNGDLHPNNHTNKKYSNHQTNGSNGRQMVDFRPDIVSRSQSYATHDPHHTETGSRTSDGSDTAIIRQTKTWNIQYDDQVNRDNIGVAAHHPPPVPRPSSSGTGLNGTRSTS